MSILNITEPVIFDESLSSYEYHTYQPYASNALRRNDEIRIPMQNQDAYTLPCESYLVVEGLLKNVPAAKVAAADGQEEQAEVTELPIHQDTYIVANGLLHLFTEARYELNGVVIDQTKNPGIASTMKNWCGLSKSETEINTSTGWEVAHTLDKTTGIFLANIPLSFLFGFAEDYRKILVNVKQELILIRSNTDLNALDMIRSRSGVRLTLTKVAWRLPHVTVNDEARLSLLKRVESDPWIEMGFINWELHEYPLLPRTRFHTWTVKSATKLEVPRFVIIGFQSGRKNTGGANASHFDHISLGEIKLFLNGVQYPYDNVRSSFDSGLYNNFYRMYACFQQAYYGRRNNPLLNRAEYKETAPLIVIDCSHQNEVVKSGAVDVRLEWETLNAVADNTAAYCLILHDRVVRYKPLSSVVQVIV